MKFKLANIKQDLKQKNKNRKEKERRRGLPAAAAQLGSPVEARSNPNRTRPAQPTSSPLTSPPYLFGKYQ
jgi:hypothetical protein